MATWKRWDERITRATEYLLVAMGLLFMSLVFLQVLSRYIFGFSVYFLNAFSSLLLVWFFLIGAGLGIKRHAHVGFRILVASLPRRIAVVLEALAHVFSLTFFVLMLWGAPAAIEASLNRMSWDLGASAFWAVAAIPAGMAFMLYNYVNVLLYRYVLGEEARPFGETEVET